MELIPMAQKQPTSPQPHLLLLFFLCPPVSISALAQPTRSSRKHRGTPGLHCSHLSKKALLQRNHCRNSVGTGWGSRTCPYLPLSAWCWEG